jgi:hypothetical protein
MTQHSMGCAWPDKRFSEGGMYVHLLRLVDSTKEEVVRTMRRKAIKLQPHEDHLLRQLHRASRIPVDQWAQRPRFLSRFTDEWNDLTGRHDSGDDLRHYILTQRKQKKWFTFDDDYDRLRSPGEESFKPAEWEALRASHEAMNVGRDQFAGDANLRDELADLFHEATGRHVSGDRLYAAIMAQQKHKENGWPTLHPGGGKKGRGFGDIDEVA